ncbi:putative RNA-directed DNA polymerase [Helianthus anomalus]
METKLHPAMTVNNIKNMVPITLEAETSQYTTWTALFEVHCRAYQVYDHLKPRPAAAAPIDTSDAAKAAAAEAESVWSRIDAIVLQWIYGTISTDLLQIIIEPRQTAYQAWTTVANHFNDNKSARQVQLQQQFSNIHLEAFPSMAAYCQQVKHLADQLNNVGAPVDNQRLVTQLLSGLTDQYESISAVLQHREPLPDFAECRSRLTMEENKKKNQAIRAAASAATTLAATTTVSTQVSHSASSSTQGRGRGGRSRGRGRVNTNNRNNRSPGNPPSHPYIVFPQSLAANQWGAFFPQPSANNTPPCPYPSVPKTPTTAPGTTAAGILGPRPDQAYAATFTPTDIQQALYTMSLQQPDPTGYMDTGATGHMANPQGPQDQGSHP